MRGDVHGGSRKYVLLSKGIGLQDAERGERVRKLVRGGTISEEIYQINCKIDGELKLEEPSPKDASEEPKKDDTAKEVKKEPKKDDTAKEVKKEPKKDDTAKEVKKEPKKA
jgi:small subunit ribosomal protein S6e